MTTSSENNSALPMNTATGLDDELEALRKEYAAQLPGRIAEISQAWQDLWDDWNTEAARSLYVLVHKLAGSGASFGFPRVSKVGRALEDQIRPLLQAFERPTDEQHNSISASLSELKRAATEQSPIDR